MRDRFTEVVADRMDIDDRLAVVLAAIGAGSFAGQLSRYPTRAINVGIREQLAVGVAAGLALEGYRPVVHSYAPFLIERAFEQLKLDVSHQGVGVIAISVGASFDAAAEGRTHQSPGDVALVSTLPGWAIYVPGHPDEVERILNSEFDRSGPVYVRLSDQSNAFAVGGTGPTLVREGAPHQPILLAVGPMLEHALALDGDFGVAYLSQVQPFPSAAIREVVGDRDVVVLEPYLEGTTLGDLTAALAGTGGWVRAIGVPKRELRRYGSIDDHLDAHRLTTPHLQTRLLPFLSRSAGP